MPNEAGPGADVVITSRMLKALAQTQADTEAVGRQALPCVLDVRKLETIQPMVDQAMARKTGQIINVGSGTSLFGMHGIVPYCASRGGITQMTKALAAEWAPSGITVNVLLPP